MLRMACGILSLHIKQRKTKIEKGWGSQLKAGAQKAGSLGKSNGSLWRRVFIYIFFKGQFILCLEF